MSRFTKTLVLAPYTEFRPGAKESAWVLLNADFAYEVGGIGSGEVIEVPRGFVTDLASVPKFLWWIVAPFGLHAKPSVLHDWLYRSPSAREVYTRKQADRVFYESMLVASVPARRAKLMYIAVRLFGNRTYSRNKSADVLKLDKLESSVKLRTIS